MATQCNYQKERKTEPLLQDSVDRFTQLPLQYPRLQEAYDEHEALFWTAKEIDYSADLKDWHSLSEEERGFIEIVLAFFAGVDGVVAENISLNFGTEITAPEARNFYAFQAMIENVHAIVYANLLDTYVSDPVRKDNLFKGLESIPVIKRKTEWALKWMSQDKPFEQRLVAFAAIEGIFFSGSFCAIFWLKDRGLMTKALGGSNELIARDEGLHVKFAVLLYHHLNNKMEAEELQLLIKEAVEIEEAFICEALRCDLVGMNADLMRDFIKFTADRLLVQFQVEPVYNVENPFDFMERINIWCKTNFFEKRNNDYRKTTEVCAWNDIEDDEDDAW